MTFRDLSVFWWFRQLKVTFHEKSFSYKDDYWCLSQTLLADDCFSQKIPSTCKQLPLSVHPHYRGRTRLRGVECSTGACPSIGTYQKTFKSNQKQHAALWAKMTKKYSMMYKEVDLRESITLHNIAYIFSKGGNRFSQLTAILQHPYYHKVMDVKHWHIR